jgi:hypothetical protein
MHPEGLAKNMQGEQDTGWFLSTTTYDHDHGKKNQQAITVNNMNNGENEGTKGPLGIKNRAVWLGGKVASS